MLQDNGTFSLQYLSQEAKLVGTYWLESGRITFFFEGFDGATGTLNGDLLEVRYGDRMEHSDFESAVYRRSH